MRSLQLRIFLSFWLVIVLSIALAATIGYIYAERVRATLQSFEVSDAMLDASMALKESGRDGLTEWLGSLPSVAASAIFVFDERGNDLLGRRPPAPVMLALQRFSMQSRGSMRDRGPANIRPARPFTQLVGPDDHVYTLFVLPPQGAVGRWVSRNGGRGMILIALLVSAAVSYFVARTITRPVQRLRESANAVAAGNLDTRVAEQVGNRRDDIGLLARDFDDMTSKLERAWQRQSELTANVSHELRSPLARLRVALELAKRRTGDVAELDRIELETERLDAMIGQLLEFSRLDADDQGSVDVIDLGELLQSVVDDVRYEFRGSTLSIDLETADNVAVQGYAPPLRSAIENVVRNAAQHGQAGGAIGVELSADQDTATIEVTDQGGGVPDHELEHIFEPFYRARSSGESNSGTGLGLAIAARAIDLNGGRISAENSEHGLGITIRLPVFH
jgi:signal transduction histidine kinase